MLAAGAHAQDVKHYRFAHDQQLNSGYSVAYDILSAKLKELSKGTMLVDQYPGAQLGQEPQIRRHRFCDRLVREHLDDLPAGRRDVAALPVRQ